MPCDADAVYADALASGISEITFISTHAREVGNLPWIHRDPFDRMLIAQAMGEGMKLISHDDNLRTVPIYSPFIHRCVQLS